MIINVFVPDHHLTERQLDFVVVMLDAFIRQINDYVESCLYLNGGDEIEISESEKKDS